MPLQAPASHPAEQTDREGGLAGSPWYMYLLSPPILSNLFFFSSDSLTQSQEPTTISKDHAPVFKMGCFHSKSTRPEPSLPARPVYLHNPPPASSSSSLGTPGQGSRVQPASCAPVRYTSSNYSPTPSEYRRWLYSEDDFRRYLGSSSDVAAASVKITEKKRVRFALPTRTSTRDSVEQ